MERGFPRLGTQIQVQYPALESFLLFYFGLIVALNCIKTQLFCFACISFYSSTEALFKCVYKWLHTNWFGAIFFKLFFPLLLNLWIVRWQFSYYIKTVMIDRRWLECVQNVDRWFFSYSIHSLWIMILRQMLSFDVLLKYVVRIDDTLSSQAVFSRICGYYIHS